ncbi:MAG: hypothetical protein K2V38_28530 [Gemmataceae bacterium]|nr:hypothetical protein [Gemmataceae bacterium]
MKWLVTFKKQVGRENVLERLKALGCAVLPSDRPVTLGADEEVLSVEGPSNLAQLAEPQKNAIKVYPNSKMSAY